MVKRKEWWNRLVVWKKGAVLGAVIGGGWTILGGVVTLIIASTGNAPPILMEISHLLFPDVHLLRTTWAFGVGAAIEPTGIAPLSILPRDGTLLGGDWSGYRLPDRYVQET
jgi:hypothetical protein